jgi:hypothetical protein
MAFPCQSDVHELTRWYEIRKVQFLSRFFALGHTLYKTYVSISSSREMTKKPPTIRFSGGGKLSAEPVLDDRILTALPEALEEDYAMFWRGRNGQGS